MLRVFAVACSLLACSALAQATASATWVGEPPEVSIQVHAPPPPERVETRPPQPSHGHVWISGHWRWQEGAYVWISGHWARPPGPGYAWVPARWVQREGAWYYREGHWTPAPATAPTVYIPPPAYSVNVSEAPPAALQERQPPAPYAGAVWIPGYWHWSGHRYVWVVGTWSAPRSGYAWVPSQWQATHHGWKWVPGHWRRA